MKIIALVFGLLLNVSAFATPAESFVLYPLDTEPNNYCSRYTSLTLDPVTNTARLEERLIGRCEIMVEPNRRTYHLTSRTQSAEGVRILGLRRHVNGVDRLIIQDYRSASVPVAHPGRVEVTELTTTEKRVVYSVPPRRAR